MVTISHPIVLDRTRVYVIGDIHGRSDLLDRMVEHISRDLDASPISDCMTVTLGDYIDRGPDSRGVLDRLVRNPFPTDFIALKGNHETLLEMFLDDPAVAEHWRRLDGLETLHSYGVPVSNLMMGANYEQAAKASLQIPCFAEDVDHHRKIFLCHGGVRPGIALERQSIEDLLWIRDEFLKAQWISAGSSVSRAHAERTARGATEPDQYRHRSVCDRQPDLRRARGGATPLSHDGLRVSSDAPPQGGTSFRIIEKIFN